MKDKFKINEYSPSRIPVPVEIENSGEYYIDLRMIMENNEKVTTKQVLLPFFSNTTFSKLEVICTHVPPWFEYEFEKLNFRSEIQSISDNEFKIIVYAI